MPAPGQNPWIDDRRAPLYVLTYPPDATDEEVILRHDQLFELWRSFDQPVAWVADLTHVRTATAGQRRIIGKYLERVRPYEEKYHRGTAFVVRDTIVRGLLTAIFWVSPPPYKYKIFATAEPAFAWAEKRLPRTQEHRKTEPQT